MDSSSFFTLIVVGVAIPVGVSVEKDLATSVAGLALRGIARRSQPGICIISSLSPSCSGNHGISQSSISPSSSFTSSRSSISFLKSISSSYEG